MVPQKSACVVTVVARDNRNRLVQHAAPQDRCVTTVTGTDGLVIHGEEQLPWTAT